MHTSCQIRLAFYMRPILRSELMMAGANLLMRPGRNDFIPVQSSGRAGIVSGARRGVDSSMAFKSVELTSRWRSRSPVGHDGPPPQQICLRRPVQPAFQRKDSIIPNSFGGAAPYALDHRVRRFLGDLLHAFGVTLDEHSNFLGNHHIDLDLLRDRRRRPATTPRRSE